MTLGRLAAFGAAPFDPVFRLTDLGRPALAELGREWMLHGHLQDRAGMPLYLGTGASPEEMQQLAIDEWMAASPIYTRRMQQAMGFIGTDLPTLFKGLQLDIGAPHQFLDFRFRIQDDAHGEFWLAHCGALMDVEPLGEDFVVGMCHHIEDPTFDATAGATNPHAQVRPIHRPPRTPAGRHPHCHWGVAIDPAFPVAAVNPNLATVSAIPVANLPVPAVVGAGRTGDGDDGWDDYSGPFDPDFTLGSLSAAALDLVLSEFAVQSHLLAGSFLVALSARLGYESAIDIGRRTLVGLAGITAERLVRAAQLEVGPAGLAKLLQIHPAFHPSSYTGCEVALVDGAVHLAVKSRRSGEDPYSWGACVERDWPEVLEAIARAVDPSLRARPRAGASAGPGSGIGFELAPDPSAPARPEPMEMALVRFSTGAAFRFSE